MESNSKPPTSKNTINHKKLIIKVIIGVLLFTIAAVSITGFISYSELQKMKDKVNVEAIYKNIFINDIDVGELTKEEALTKLNANMQTDTPDIKITLKSGDQSTEILQEGTKTTYNFTPVVEEAYDYARKGSIKERYNLIVALQDLPKVFTYEPQQSQAKTDIKNVVEAFTAQLGTEPVNATLTRSGGKFTVTNGEVGYEANVAETLARVESLIALNQSAEVEVVMEEVAPEFVAADFENAKSLIGSFQTTFTGSIDLSRNVNIVNAAAKINDYVLYPNEVFSTNAVFGEMTHANGYRPASVIVGGKLVDGYGGGVCQVSSTLYNALLFAELKIVERQNHSLKVGYTDWGFDATLAGDYIDLKFKNDTPYPIFVEAYLKDNKVVTNIYGYEVHDPSRKIVFSNALLGTLAPAAEQVTEDSTLPLGKRVVTSPPKSGYKYQVYKTVYENGEQIEKTIVNDSTYRAVRGEVLLGTGENVTDEDAEPITANISAEGADPVEMLPPTNPSNPDPTPPPSATAPPATDPPVTAPPATDPPVTAPPVTAPPVTDPPATDPPATDPPPATDDPSFDDGPIMPDF